MYSDDRYRRLQERADQAWGHLEAEIPGNNLFLDAVVMSVFYGLWLSWFLTFVH